MKTLLLLITLFSFLQSAFLGVNLVVVLVAARSLVIDDRDNLFLAFFGGLILSFLTQVNLGYYPLVLILIVKTSVVLKRLPVSFNLLTIFLAGGFLIAIGAILNSLFIDQPVKVWPLVIEAVLLLPFFYLVRFWEERFLTKSVKLKV